LSSAKCKIKNGVIQSIKWWDTVYQMVGYSLSNGGIQSIIWGGAFSYSAIQNVGQPLGCPLIYIKKNNTHSSSL